MFDRLEWWQVLLLLAPIVALMSWIKQRELQARITSFDSLTGAQKAWVFIMLLPPGLAAGLLSEFNREDLVGYIHSSRSIRGSGRNLVKPVLREFFEMVPKKLQRRRGEPSDLLELAVLRAEEKPSEVVATLRKNWGAPDPDKLPEVKKVPAGAESGAED